jgi:hypothetical protein
MAIHYSIDPAAHGHSMEYVATLEFFDGRHSPVQHHISCCYSRAKDIVIGAEADSSLAALIFCMVHYNSRGFFISKVSC